MEETDEGYMDDDEIRSTYNLKDNYAWKTEEVRTKLRDKGILSARKSANKVFYKVTDLKTLKLIEMMREVFCPHHK